MRIYYLINYLFLVLLFLDSGFRFEPLYLKALKSVSYTHLDVYKRQFISQSAYNPGLIVVTPEQRVPAVPFLHLYLPLNKELFQLLIIRRHQRPFIPVLVIHFQMVEIKAHGEFLFLRRRIPDTVFDRRDVYKRQAYTTVKLRSVVFLMNNDPRGTMFQQGDIMRINNAYVEEDVYKRQS